MSNNNTDDIAADAVIRAHKILRGWADSDLDELCDILRRWSETGKPIEELFSEIKVCQEVLLESQGLRPMSPDETGPCPF